MKLITVELTHEDGTDFAAWSTTGEVVPAHAIDRLIRVLAETRKTMEPAFPPKLPLVIKDPPQVNGPAWQWSIEGDGSLVLNFRHPGLGWLGFRLPDVEGFHTNLVDVIQQRNLLRAEIGPPAH
ncbi:hypothetical protein [Variovorax paradoxus]|uniref:Uncharacterized protein n=1 Tax=Variovorax paradoxus TaxID=34073 RepID=A0A679JLG9_VARPD|nr:hypothetical protein VVAX_04054 [Variovorax paradoxus]